MRFVVTGGASGIGYFAVEQLAAAGHSVIIAARSSSKAAIAIESVLSVTPSASLSFVELDVASLASVAAAASAIGPVDGIALNAGLTGATKGREVTVDGLERMVATNYLGHFALVAQLYPSLAPDARVVAMGSMSTRLARLDLSDLLQERGRYNASKAYAYSKHAIQAFGFEFDRRLRERGRGIRSIVSHPGFALDVQSPSRPGVNDLTSGARFSQNLVRPMTQGKSRGALPLVHALTSPLVEGGQYWGPSGGLRGRPTVKNPVAQDRDPAIGAALWELSEQWTHVKFDV